MFRNMRRADRAMTDEAALELLKKCEYGVVSTIGNDGYPYGVPVNYVLKNGTIYFHCATDGHKLDNMIGNSKVSFCAVGDTKVLSEKFSMKYESVVVFGRAKIADDEEKREALLAIIEKYSPEFMEGGRRYIDSDFSKTKVVKIEIEYMTGKMANK